MRIKSAGNTGFASGGVTCKLGALCFYSGSVLVDSFVLRNPPERKARNRWAQAKKEMKSYRILLFIFTCGLSTAIYGQANENVPIESLKLLCKNDSINICIPKGYLSTDTFNYMEGYIQTFIYPDSSTVSILCGANATL
ncbi:MAG: hypothetical protein KDC25_14215, partial [Saprospiraceae bacterium]|nr:hypothetical protein [Saprospiraceae bacterium]